MKLFLRERTSYHPISIPLEEVGVIHDALIPFFVAALPTVYCYSVYTSHVTAWEPVPNTIGADRVNPMYEIHNNIDIKNIAGKLRQSLTMDQIFRKIGK